MEEMQRQNLKIPQPTILVGCGLFKLLGTVSGMNLTTFVYPIDVLKVRFQFACPEVRGMLMQMFQKKWHNAFDTGLSAGVMRQPLYTTTRLGVNYRPYDFHKKWYYGTSNLSDKVWYDSHSRAIARCPDESTSQYRGLYNAFSKCQTFSAGMNQHAIKKLFLGGSGDLWKGSALYHTRFYCHTIFTFCLFNVFYKLYQNNAKEFKMRS